MPMQSHGHGTRREEPFFLYLFSGTFSGYPDGSTITIDGFSFTINYVNHSAVLTAQ